MAKPRIKHKVVPPEFRKRYGNDAYAVYDTISFDVMNLEGDDGKPFKPSAKDWVEIIRDANRILEHARQRSTSRGDYVRVPTEEQIKRSDEDEAYLVWLTANEYNPEFDRDMNKIVKELL